MHSTWLHLCNICMNSWFGPLSLFLWLWTFFFLFSCKTEKYLQFSYLRECNFQKHSRQPSFIWNVQLEPFIFYCIGSWLTKHFEYWGRLHIRIWVQWGKNSFFCVSIFNKDREFFVFSYKTVEYQVWQEMFVTGNRCSFEEIKKPQKTPKQRSE